MLLDLMKIAHLINIIKEKVWLQTVCKAGVLSTQHMAMAILFQILELPNILKSFNRELHIIVFHK